MEFDETPIIHTKLVVVLEKTNKSPRSLSIVKSELLKFSIYKRVKVEFFSLPNSSKPIYTFIIYIEKTTKQFLNIAI